MTSIIIVLIVMLSLAVGTGAMFYFTEVFRRPVSTMGDPFPSSSSPVVESTPTTTGDETANWKTYKKDTKYQFNYPREWVLENIVDESHEQQQDFSLKSPNYKPAQDYEDTGNGVELILIRSKAEKETIEEMYEYDHFAGQDESSKTTLIVAGEKAIRYDFSYEMANATNTILVHDGTYYWISFRWPNEETKNKYLPAYDQILFTFRFLE